MGGLARSSVHLNVITCGFLHKKSPRRGGQSELLLAVNVTGQCEYSYKVPIFAQMVIEPSGPLVAEVGRCTGCKGMAMCGHY